MPKHETKLNSGAASATLVRSPTRQPPPWHGWRRHGILSMGAALLVHAVALGAVGTLIGTESVGNGGSARADAAALQVRVAVRQRARPQDFTVEPAATAIVPIALTAPLAPAAPIAFLAPAVGGAEDADGTTAARPSPLARRAHFYGTSEVDVPAQPETDWNIDVAALDSLATSRIVFTAYIGSDGSVLRCEVTEPSRLSADVRRALGERLERTRMRPARLGGEAVASRREIEMTTGGGP